MNPYFEQADRWPGFQLEFIAQLRRQLAAQAPADYVVDVEEHIYIQELPEGPRDRRGQADVSVSRPEPAGGGEFALAVLEEAAPVEVDLELPGLDIERIPFLVIRDGRGWELVTVIELLSPTNKGRHRSEYLAKRLMLLGSSTHLVEIDLLRAGEAMPPPRRTDYSVLVSRAERRPRVQIWPFGLRQPLPWVPIPLRPPDGDLRADLHQILHRTYDDARYERSIYRGAPEPPLSAEDAEWARQFLPAPPA
jgi:hypothetical protein